MRETSEGRKRIGIENLTLDNFPRDLLQRFMSSSTTSTSAREEEEEEEDSEELELNLGLSLGGRFGIDKSKKIKLVRSSSIIGTVPFIRNASITGDDSASPAPAPALALMRTASLPVETEEEWRKRKEIQTLRRVAAKRRRSEKQRTGKLPEKENYSPATISRQNSIVGGGVDLEAAVAVAVAMAARGRQGSAESIGGSSLGISELDSRVGCQGSRSPAGGSQSQPPGERSRDGGQGESSNKCSTSGLGLDLGQNPNPSLNGNKGREIGTSAVEEMPSVFAKGEGPDGRRVDGILYRYGKGAEVRIMCVCHGRFLSPADFVKHAGGGDVDNPLRHIVINPSPASLL